MTRYLIVAICLGLIVCGCSKDSRRFQPVVPVAMKVICQGKPVAHGQVVLHPLVEKEGAVIARPNGYADLDGVVKLTTYRTHDGAPAGEYVVTVIWSPVIGESGGDDEIRESDRLRGRYADPALSKLRVTIEKGLPQPLVLEIQ